MERATLQDLSDDFDLIVIGGGASGLGAAVDAASRGFKTLLLEQADFAQGTSSRSSKLIHGGVRYLRDGQFSFVIESLKERALLAKNAPHLVHALPFILPTESSFTRGTYWAGLKMYDWLAGSNSFGASTMLTKKEVLSRIPNLQGDLVEGGVCYFDGQFDDARLAIDLAKTLNDLGSTPLNYMRVESLIKTNGKISGVRARDMLTGKTYPFHAKAVINATGAYADTIRHLDDASLGNCIQPSQGTHIVLPKSFYPGDTALLIPQTKDGRVLFIMPWLGSVLIGTTDIPISNTPLEPLPTPAEIDYLLEYTSKYLNHSPTAKDILSAFSGIRPLVKAGKDVNHTAALSRDHKVLVSNDGLISLLGGKWTTYRKMGEDAVDTAIKIAGLPKVASKTESLPIHGQTQTPPKTPSTWDYYGSDSHLVDYLSLNDRTLKEKLHPDLPCRPIDVLFAVREEMALQVEDVLSRRTRCLLLNAAASGAIAPQVAAIMAKELKFGPEWEKIQIEQFLKLSESYLHPILKC